MLALSTKLLEANREVRAIVAGQYDHVMVDEYQDTNRRQARLIELIAGNRQSGGHANVMVVTDPGQSIYGFRGAWYRNTADFIARWKPKVYPLSLNYRSTQAILDLANEVDGTTIEGKRRQQR